MKRNISLLLCVVLMCTFSVMGCTADKNDSNTNNILSYDETSSMTVSETSSVADISSADDMSSVDDTSSQAQSSQAVSSSQPSQQVYENVSAQVGPYTIYDIYNTKGLSNERIGYSFGIAKNGKPHSVSVNNQKKFDENPQYKALALDTVSTDKCMYLTFDCGYEYQQLTGKILDTLKEKNVKAAFFCTLNYLKKNPKLVQRMIDEGHIVGNHSSTHPDFTTISRKKQAEEIYNFEKYLKEQFNYSSPYFRFPSGAHSDNCLELVSSMGYRSVFWSVAYSDWDTEAQKGADYAFDTVTARYHPGAVILLHAVSSDNAEALGRMIDKAVQDEYTFKSLDEYYK